MNQKFIVIDGKTYSSVEEMPEDVRRKYESAMQKLGNNQGKLPNLLQNADLFADKNNNGIPDAFEGMLSNITTSTKIIADGKTYDSLDELPPEIRAKYDQAMNTMDANHNGMPDFVEALGNLPVQKTNQAAVSFGMATPPHPSQPVPVSSTIEPESSGSWRLLLTGILLIGLCVVAAGAGVWYYFIR